MKIECGENVEEDRVKKLLISLWDLLHPVKVLSQLHNCDVKESTTSKNKYGYAKNHYGNDPLPGLIVFSENPNFSENMNIKIRDRFGNLSN